MAFHFQGVGGGGAFDAQLAGQHIVLVKPRHLGGDEIGPQGERMIFPSSVKLLSPQAETCHSPARQGYASSRRRPGWLWPRQEQREPASSCCLPTPRRFRHSSGRENGRSRRQCGLPLSIRRAPQHRCPRPRRFPFLTMTDSGSSRRPPPPPQRGLARWFDPHYSGPRQPPV